VVKAFVRTAHEMTRFDDANAALMNQTVLVSQLLAIFIPFMLLLLNLAIVSAVWFGGRFALAGRRFHGGLSSDDRPRGHGRKKNAQGVS
jgi:ABC-type multidrug transport system fused ATPase/permease subunit